MNEEAIKAGRCEILHGDVMDLPFTDASFHVVTAFETIYYWPDLTKAFEQVYRVLKENGIFMICNESNGEMMKKGNNGRKSSKETWYIILSRFRFYCSGLGFTNIKIDTNDKGWLCAVGEKNSI